MDLETIQKIARLTNEAKAATEKAEYQTAAGAYQKACLIHDEEVLRLQCARASVLLSAENYDEVAALADMLTRSWPRHATAWYVGAMARYHLGQFEDAKSAFDKAVQFEADLSVKTSYMDWAARCDHAADPSTQSSFTTDVMAVTDSSNSLSPTKDTPPKGSASKEDLSQDRQPKDTTRLQWYQSATHVNIDIYAKNVVKEESSITFSDQQLTVRLKRPGMEEYTMNTNLAAPVNPDECKWNMSRFKVEIRLQKVAAGSTWKSLDSGASVVSVASEAREMSRLRIVKSKERQKAWDNVTDKELKDYSEDDSSMALFKTIYKDADDDTRRAMMKSYSESGGQVLSTDWGEVKKKKVVYEGDK